MAAYGYGRCLPGPPSRSRRFSLGDLPPASLAVSPERTTAGRGHRRGASVAARRKDQPPPTHPHLGVGRAQRGGVQPRRHPARLLAAARRRLSVGIRPAAASAAGRSLATTTSSARSGSAPTAGPWAESGGIDGRSCCGDVGSGGADDRARWGGGNVRLRLAAQPATGRPQAARSTTSPSPASGCGRSGKQHGGGHLGP